MPKKIIEKNGWVAKLVTNNDGSSVYTLKRGRGDMPDEIKAFCELATGTMQQKGSDTTPAFHKQPRTLSIKTNKGK